MTALVEERRAQIGIGPVCEALGLARPAFYRRRGAARRGTGGPRVSGGPRQPDRATVLTLLHEARFVDLPAAQFPGGGSSLSMSK